MFSTWTVSWRTKLTVAELSSNKCVIVCAYQLSDGVPTSRDCSSWKVADGDNDIINDNPPLLNNGGVYGATVNKTTCYWYSGSGHRVY